MIVTERTANQGRVPKVRLGIDICGGETYENMSPRWLWRPYNAIRTLGLRQPAHYYHRSAARIRAPSTKNSTVFYVKNKLYRFRDSVLIRQPYAAESRGKGSPILRRTQAFLGLRIAAESSLPSMLIHFDRATSASPLQDKWYLSAVCRICPQCGIDVISVVASDVFVYLRLAISCTRPERLECLY